ncbi:MAG: hypothetical protein K1V95_08260, partial [Eubacterium sp.]
IFREMKNGLFWMKTKSATVRIPQTIAVITAEIISETIFCRFSVH